MGRKLVRLFIILIALFFLLGFWYYRTNIYSKEVLKLEILGPAEAGLADQVEYIVKYKNNGRIALEDSKLIFEYPSSSLIIKEENQEASQGDYLRQEVAIENIYPGEEKTISFKGRLLGKEGEAKVAKAWLDYRPKNLRARYESDTTFTTLVKGVPLTFEFDLPSKIDPGKEISFRLNYFSNLNYPLSNLRVKIEYPSGFEFRESQPTALAKDEWDIPLLNKADGGRVNITGLLIGEVGETKIFRATLGVWQEEEFILLKEITRGVEIAQPLIFVSQKINDSPQYVANPGEYLHYEISFKNTGEGVLENLFLVVQLEKDLFDLDTLRADSGQIQKESGFIIWDQNALPFLKFLPSLEEGKIDFWGKLKTDLPKNTSLRTKISIGLAKQEFVNKINTKLILSQKGYFNQGPFRNSGPLPPKIGQITTYTVSWLVQNFSNDARNLKIKAILPSYVNLIGNFSPSEARFTFDSSSREIVWELGDLPSGALSPELFFQVSFVPLASQIGQAPDLISQARVLAEDVWTGQTLQSIAPGFDTTLPDDQTFSSGRGIVQ